ncbi:hypothetical protein CTA2_9759, partial [Colletotrichum tanaceti]
RRCRPYLRAFFQRSSSRPHCPYRPGSQLWRRYRLQEAPCPQGPPLRPVLSAAYACWAVRVERWW